MLSITECSWKQSPLWRALGKWMHCWLPVTTHNTKTQLFTLGAARGDITLSPGERDGWSKMNRKCCTQHIKIVFYTFAEKLLIQVHLQWFLLAKAKRGFHWKNATLSVFICIVISLHFLHEGIFFMCVKQLVGTQLLWSRRLRINFPKRAYESVLHGCFCLWRDSFSPCSIQTWVTVLSRELMFILGSQIPTFPNRAWLTWKSTDAFFILQLQSLRTGPKQPKRRYLFFFFQGRCVGDAVCILTTCLALSLILYPIHFNWFLFQVFFPL